MASSTGVLCGAGFETPAEALFLRKKMMVVPMKGQYGQHCNAAALEGLGVSVIRDLSEKHSYKIGEWLETEEGLRIDFPDHTELIVRNILETALVSYIHSRVIYA